MTNITASMISLNIFTHSGLAVRPFFFSKRYGLHARRGCLRGLNSREHACALMNTGGVKCWGGIYFDGYHNVPIDITGLDANVMSLAAGDRHDCAVTASGRVKCWESSEHLAQAEADRAGHVGRFVLVLRL
jgi:hypothetical protein